MTARPPRQAAATAALTCTLAMDDDRTVVRLRQPWSRSAAEATGVESVAEGQHPNPQDENIDAAIKIARGLDRADGQQGAALRDGVIRSGRDLRSG